MWIECIGKSLGTDQLHAQEGPGKAAVSVENIESLIILSLFIAKLVFYLGMSLFNEVMCFCCISLRIFQSSH